MIPVAKLSRNFHQFYFKFQFEISHPLPQEIEISNQLLPPTKLRLQRTRYSSHGYYFTKSALHTKRIYTRTHLESIHGAKLENKRCRSWEPFFNPPTPVPPPPPPPFRSPVLLATTLSSLESVRIYARLQTIVLLHVSRYAPEIGEREEKIGSVYFWRTVRVWKGGISRLGRTYLAGWNYKPKGSKFLYRLLFVIFRATEKSRISEISFREGFLPSSCPSNQSSFLFFLDGLFRKWWISRFKNSIV